MTGVSGLVLSADRDGEEPRLRDLVCLIKHEGLSADEALLLQAPIELLQETIKYSPSYQQ